jgi:hypothetical protein
MEPSSNHACPGAVPFCSVSKSLCINEAWAQVRAHEPAGSRRRVFGLCCSARRPEKRPQAGGKLGPLTHVSSNVSRRVSARLAHRLASTCPSERENTYSSCGSTSSCEFCDELPFFDPAPFALADAAGAGCADAIAVAPNNDATTRAEIASLDRMEFLLIRISDAGVKTGEPNEGSLARERNSEIR